ncbi:alpha-N-acetylneuraminide alpha-2,8-sialyltransferase-like [Saccoglossus kowalevskii]|uniref:Alpha-N-acetylneuraminide alpha-2,8-sialyltransferase-like n=1 Tax=Saccoglossus kowalevskii TaxID=10224 RepID=A0ABM0MUN9_SACKO|nr:PREDICTED: alpha-N-acetylneuraminide alpha-2,8-sialyltransferase-like [Saccoglossus kowalevskii]
MSDLEKEDADTKRAYQRCKRSYLGFHNISTNQSTFAANKTTLGQMKNTVNDINNWKSNKIHLYDLRNKLNGFMPNSTQFYLSSNASLSSQKMFLNKSPTERSTYRRCSIVGNGGILKDSGCGDEIDKSDLILRANLPVIRNFTHDAGRSMNLTTFNPSIIYNRFNYSMSAFSEALEEYEGHILFTSTPNFTVPAMNHIKKNTSLDLLLLNRDYLGLVRRFWKVEKIVSSGLLLLTMGLPLCEEIHLFGFWPFNTDIDGNALPYHYTGDSGFDEVFVCAHNMGWEMQNLLELHNRGIVKLHLGKCGHTNGL